MPEPTMVRRLLDHPGPSTTRRHVRVMAALVTVAVVGILTGRHLSR